MKKEFINLPNAELVYFPVFYNEEESNLLYKKLFNAIPWEQHKIKLFGKEILQPRLTAFYGEPERSYSYSGLEMKPREFNQDLLEIKQKCSAYADATFNSCLANLYRNGSDSMGWHADNEKELGTKPVIASVSFGAERIFHLKHKKDPTARYKIRLQHGSLLIMKGETQDFWKHQLPKTRKEVSPRINLTFREIS